MGRKAYCRRDISERTRDQKRAMAKAGRESFEIDRPRWVKRGIQPAVEPEKPDPLKRVVALIGSIQDEPNADERKRLECELSAAFEPIVHEAVDGNEEKLRELYNEIAETFRPIIDGDVCEAVEAMGRGDWKELHRALVLAKFQARKWWNKSQSFGRERWGDAFVAESESEMMLALGIEPTKAKPKTADVPALLHSATAKGLGDDGRDSVPETPPAPPEGGEGPTPPAAKESPC